MHEVRKVIFAPKIRVDRLQYRETVQLINDIVVCREFHILPRAGGLYDQDSFFVYVLQHYISWISEKEELDTKAAQAMNRGGR